MDDVHPIRIWRVDERFRANIEATRQIIKRNQRQFKQVGGVQFIENELVLNRDAIDSFETLQGHLFKHNESSQFRYSFLKFWDYHRQVFAFDRNLAEALSATDIGDVPWSELRLPHEEFYLALGDYGQQSFLLGDFEYIIDGVYIRRVNQASIVFPNDSLLMHFTAQLLRPSYRDAKQLRKGAGFHYAEPIYDYCLSGKGCATVGEAIARGEAEYLAHCDHRDSQVLESARELAAEFGVMPFGERLQLNRKKFERGRQIIAEAIAPIFNAIFYLAARPDHREVRFSKNAPMLLVKAATGGNESERKSVPNRLARLGFSAITFVRDPELEVQLPGEETGRHLRAHWRRGHWRNQPYGANLSLRRWLWIKPVLVKPDEPFELGAIHDVDSDPANEPP